MTPDLVYDQLIGMGCARKLIFSYAAGYSTRDNDFYSAWDEIARDRDRFLDWMTEHVLAGAQVPA